MHVILNSSNRNLFNSRNERIIYDYLKHCQAIKRADGKTLDKLHNSIRSFEAMTDFVDFDNFCPAMATEFLDKLRHLELSSAYLMRLSLDLKHFFKWLANEPKGKKIKANDVDYLNLTRNELNKARAPKYQVSIKLERLIEIAKSIPAENMYQRRNRAFFAFNTMGSFREEELRNMTIGSLKYDRDNEIHFVFVDPREVKGVKFNKSREATLLKIPELVNFVTDWIAELRTHGFGDKDPMFPAIPQKLGLPTAPDKKTLSSAQVRNIFKQIETDAGEPAMRLHNFRHARARHFQQKTKDNLNIALQQDMGHSSLETTRRSYGMLTSDEQRQLIAGVKFD